MKIRYSKFRIGLMTFALGLASVFILRGSLYYSDEIYVDLPKAKSDSVFVVIPKRKICMPHAGGSHGGFTDEFIKQINLNCFSQK